MKSGKALFASAAMTLSLAVAGAATAQDGTFPSKPLEMILHASPGGGTDLTARMIIPGAAEKLGEDIVPVYKRGGGAKAAHEYFQSQPADGHTLMALTQTHLYQIAQNDSPIEMDDIVGVARAMDDPTFLVVRKDSPYKTIEELVEASKEKALNWGVGQIGSTEHIGLARFAEAAGIKYKVVPFGSGGPMVNALMSGSIDGTIPNVSEAKSQIEDGTFIPLVVLDDERLEDFPDVPTSYEKGYNVKVTTTRGYGVRKGTPPERIKALEEALLAGMKTEEFEKYIRSAGLNPKTSVAGSEEWDAQLKEEYAQAAEILEKLDMVKK